MIMRFVGVDRAPPGFYVDEAAVSAQVFCLAQGGHTLDGARWPLLTPVLGGGYSSIAYQAPAVAWAKVNGGSIAAMRRFAALCGALAVIGVFLAALWANETEAATAPGPRAFASLRMTTATVAAVSAAISPWAFQFSRIAWDPAVAPVYLSWALAALFLAVRPNERRDWVSRIAIVASALLFGAACLCYPPLRMQVPLVLLAF